MSKFYFMIGKAGFNSELELAEHLEVSLRTVKKWRKTDKPPRAVFLYLQLRAGEMNGVSENWNGFKLLNDCIENPQGDFIYYYEIKAIKYLYKSAEIQRYKLCRQLEQSKKEDDTGEYKPLYAVK